MESMIICYCKGVSEADIINAVKNKNARCEEDIQTITNASTGCGRCRRAVKYILERELKKLSEAKE